MWKLKAPPRTRLLMWSILKNKVSTGDNLSRRGLCGHYWCCLYKDNTEYLDHLFLFCPITIDLWTSILTHTLSPINWRGYTTKKVWANWWSSVTPPKAKNLPLVITWEIWIARNRSIFRETAPHWPSIIARIIGNYSSLPKDLAASPAKNIIPESINHSQPWAYFGGSAQETGFGGGVVLYILNKHHYHIQMELGNGINNFVEISTAKYLIQFAIEKDYHNLQVFDGSKIASNWINKTTTCHAFTLRHILDEVHRYIRYFDNFVCHHIYREQNSIANKLSKEAAINPCNIWMIQEQRGGEQCQYYHRPYMDQAYQAQ